MNLRSKFVLNATISSVLDRTPRDIENAGEWGHGSVGKYNILGQVGEGTYGQVYKAKDSKGRNLFSFV